VNRKIKEKILREDFPVDWANLFLLALAAPFFLFPSMKFAWIFFIIPLILISRWLVKNRFYERSILDWAIAVLLIQVFVTCIIVPDISFSLPKIAGVLFGIAFCYSIVALMTSKKLIGWGILGFLGAGFLLSIICLFGIKWHRELYFKTIIAKAESIIPKIKWNLPGAEEGFNANAIGGILILIVPLCLTLCISHLKRKKENHLVSNRLLPLIFFLLILFIVSILLFFTQSIGSWIGVTISIWIILLSWKWKRWSLVLILVLGILIVFLNPAKTTRLVNRLKQDILKREASWIVAVNTVSQHPLFGIGMNRFRQIPNIGYSRAHAHNHLLHTAAEIGIPGLMAYLAILFAAGYMCYEVWRKSKIGWMRMAALGLGCGQMAHFIFGMADSIPLGAKVGIFFWFSLGLIVAMYNYMLKNTEKTQN
jgi:putative inorganic carbon (HCO3(-)) transporter